jgi:hypothetical protein
MRRVVISLLSCAAALLFFSTAAFADECFKSSKKLNNDAQIIRLKAMDMGWKVGKTVSLAAASAISGKNGIYPKDDVEICLKEEDDELQIRAQSKSRDAGKAKWRKVMGKRMH